MNSAIAYKQTTTEKYYPFSAVLCKDDPRFFLFMFSAWKRAASPEARPVSKFIVLYWGIKTIMA
jgi:hypothetical protein